LYAEPRGSITFTNPEKIKIIPVNKRLKFLKNFIIIIFKK